MRGRAAHAEYTNPLARHARRRASAASRRGGALCDEFLEQQARQPLGVVPDHAVHLEQIVEDAAQPHALQLSNIGAHRLSALARDSAAPLRRDRAGY